MVQSAMDQVQTFDDVGISYRLHRCHEQRCRL